MNEQEYREIIHGYLKIRTNSNEEMLVRTAKQNLEYLECLSQGEQRLYRNSIELWHYYSTHRVPARTKARGLWLKGVKGVMSGKPSKFIHLTDKALGEFLKSTKDGQHEYQGSLNDLGRKKVEVIIEGGLLKCRLALLHGVYRYVLAPSRSSAPQLFAYEEGDDTWKHSQFLRGAPVLYAGMIHVFKGRPIQFSNGSGHYQPPSGSIEKVKSWLISHGVQPKLVMFDVTGKKATEVDSLFGWMSEQEEITKKKGRADWEFKSYKQLLATHEAYNKLGAVKKQLARMQGVEKSERFSPRVERKSN